MSVLIIFMFHPRSLSYSMLSELTLAQLYKVMEIQRQIMDSELSQMRPPKKCSPGTSDSDKGVDVTCEHPRKKHRRGKHRRKWKPYSRLTMEEKRELEAREAARALKREARLAGKPSAPWNTTQFIMEDHGINEINIPRPRVSRTTSMDSSLSDDEYYESPEEEAFERGLSISMENDFEMAYKEVASKRMDDMSKSQLIEDYINLEQQLVAVKTEVGTVRKQLEEVETKSTQLQEENERLKLLLMISDKPST